MHLPEDRLPGAATVGGTSSDASLAPSSKTELESVSSGLRAVLAPWDRFVFRGVQRRRADFWGDGVNPRCLTLAVGFALAVVAMIVLYINRDLLPWPIGKLNHTGQALLGVLIAALPPLFYWDLASRFHLWAHQRAVGDPSRPWLAEDDIRRHAEDFKGQVDAGKAFWGALLGVYGAVLLKF